MEKIIPPSMKQVVENNGKKILPSMEYLKFEENSHPFLYQILNFNKSLGFPLKCELHVVK
jgi:hypothetical protein